MNLAVAVLTWNLIGGTLFICLPSDPVDEVCIEESWCFVPENPQVIVVPWDGPPPIVRARLADGSVQYAVPYPAYSG